MSILLVFLFSFPVSAAEGPQILSPKAGDALQGLVIITGKIDLEGFKSLEIAFNYGSGNPDSWFLIHQSQTAVKEGVLAVWDTTTIADGTYRLRARVTLQDGQVSDVILANLRVRNYTPIETNTPLPARSTVIVDLSPTPIPFTLTPRLTPTPMPVNPITIQPVQLAFGLVEGMAIALIALFLLGLYLWAKRR